MLDYLIFQVWNQDLIFFGSIEWLKLIQFKISQIIITLFEVLWNNTPPPPPFSFYEMTLPPPPPPKKKLGNDISSIEICINAIDKFMHSQIILLKKVEYLFRKMRCERVWICQKQIKNSRVEVSFLEMFGRSVILWNLKRDWCNLFYKISWFNLKLTKL